MSRTPSPFSVQAKLNNVSPGAADVGLGNIINDLIVAHNALVAKLNLDAGVTDTNYASVVDLTQR
jgi:hypothetical protein